MSEEPETPFTKMQVRVTVGTITSIAAMLGNVIEHSETLLDKLEAETGLPIRKGLAKVIKPEEDEDDTRGT